MIREYIENIKAFSPNARLFLIGNFCLSVGTHIFWLLYNLYLKDIGFTESFIGNVLSIRAIGSVLIALPAAALINRVHIRYIVIWGAAFSAAGFFLQSVVTQPLGLMGASFLTGMATTVYMVAAAPFFMRNSTPKERVHLFSVNSAINMGAGFIGSAIGGVLRTTFYQMTSSSVLSYRFALLSAVVLALIGIIPYSRLQASPLPKSKDENDGTHKHHTDWHTIFKLTLPSFIVGMGAGLTIPFINLYFKDVFQLNTDIIGVIFAFGQIAMFTGMLSSPILAARIGKVATILATQIISIPFMLIMAFTRSLVLVIPAFLIRGALMNMATPVSQTFSMEKVPPKDQALTNSLLNLSWTGSWAVSAFFGGRIIEHYGFALSFCITSFLYFTSTLFYYIFFRKDIHYR
jgi:MFS family permease